MGESENRSIVDLEKTLKPFFQRASEAEDRLSRLEAALESKKDSGNEDQAKLISQLQSKLENANAELLAERAKAEKLSAENGRLQYRIIHLLRAAKGASSKVYGEEAEGDQPKV